jgi:hypothetical protein
MLIPGPILFRRRRDRRPRPPLAPPAPASLALVQASYQPGGQGEPSIRLMFDRAIDASGLVGNQIVIADGSIAGLRFDAMGDVTIIDPQTIEMGLTDIESFAGPDVRLTASAASGIVAVDDGGTWAGVTDLLLPFP